MTALDFAPVTKQFLSQIQDERTRLPDGKFEQLILPKWERELSGEFFLLPEEVRERLRRALTEPLDVLDAELA